MDSLNGKIKVLNYELSPVGFPSTVNPKGIFIEARDEDNEYKMERVLWEDVELENGKSDLFKVGRLRFHPDEEEEIYKKLGIEDKENIKTDKELMSILTNDNIENLKKINAIKSITLITRMKSILFKMERVNKTPPHNVIAVVSERCEELKNGGKKNENSVVARIMATDKQHNDESKLQNTIDSLAKEVELLKTDKANTESQSHDALQDLLKIVQDLKAENAELKKGVSAESESEVVKDNDKDEVKKAGRPATKK